MSYIIFYFYKWVIVPLAWMLLQLFRPLAQGKLQQMILDKNQGFVHLKHPHTQSAIAINRPIWIHAASGEIEYARPVIRELKKIHPHIPILVTYSSPSAKKILESIHEIDAWAALPWDLDFVLNDFITKWNPRVILYARTDVWPVLSEVCKKKNIPAALFSATFADNSSRLTGITKYLTKYSMQNLSVIHCVSEEDKKNIEALKLETPVIANGDTRFDQVFHRLENPKPLKNSLMPQPEDFVMIAGSTWPEDETILIPALKKAKLEGCKIILAPHETTATHLNSLESQLTEAGLKHIRYSQSDSWGTAKVLVIDQVGILAELYTWADVAFIGGSFKKQVHSVMEALAAGLPVLVGPHHQNNREALFYQKKNFSSGMIVQVVHTSEDIVVLLERMKKHQLQLPNIKEEIRLEIGKNRHSTQRVLSNIEKWL
ncbi:3-deoxy-D-manno-octulosonic acid transferase [compost metagenome]